MYSDVESFKEYILELEHELEPVARDQGWIVCGSKWPLISDMNIIMLYQTFDQKFFGNFLICIGLCNDHKVLMGTGHCPLLLLFFKFLLGKLVFQEFK